MSTKKNTKEAYAEAKWFAALSNPVRLAILRILAGGPKSVVELAQALRVYAAVAHHHVKTLEAVKLIYTQREGNERRCTLVNVVVQRDTLELASPAGANVVLPRE